MTNRTWTESNCFVEGERYRVVDPCFGPFSKGDTIYCVETRYVEDLKLIYLTFAERDGFLGHFRGTEHEVSVRYNTNVHGVISERFFQ